MKLVILYGRPAVGKLTVGRALAEQSGWRLFHNHLIVDALLAVFEFGSRPFVELRESIWLDVFLRANHEGIPGLIFTFSPENSVRQEFITRITADLAARRDSLHWIELTCDEATAESRLVAASRTSTKKLTSLKLYRSLRDSGAFATPVMPAPELSIDTGTLAAETAARAIWDRVRPDK